MKKHVNDDDGGINKGDGDHKLFRVMVGRKSSRWLKGRSNQDCGMEVFKDCYRGMVINCWLMTLVYSLFY